MENGEVTPADLGLPPQEQIESIKPSSLEGVETKSEGIKPREFIQTIEALSEIRAVCQMKYEDEYKNFGHVRETPQNQEEFKFGSLSQDQYRKGFELVQGLREALLEKAPDRYKEHIEETLDALRTSFYIKHRTCTTLENQVSQEFPGLDRESVRFNRLCANKIFSALYPTIPAPDGLLYSESPQGILFTLADIEQITNVRNAIIERNTPPQQVADYEKGVNTNLCGGFQDICTVTIDEGFVNKVGVMFLPQEGGKDVVRVNKFTRMHEEQHIVDHNVLYNSDMERMWHLDAPDRSETPLNPYNQHALKSEIFAFAEGGTNGYVASQLLRDRAGSYNYEGILGPAFGPLTLEQQEKSSKHKNLVMYGTNNFDVLTLFYDEYYHDVDVSRRVAIGVLDSFPVEDWTKVTNAVKKYSSHQEYNEKMRAEAAAILAPDPKDWLRNVFSSFRRR